MYLFITLAGLVAYWIGTWWLYRLPIIDEVKVWDDEAPLVPLAPPVDIILKVMGKGEKGELEKSDKVLLRVLSWVDKVAFLLPISMIGVASGDNPLLLLEMRGFEDMKKKTKDLGKGRLLLISRLPFPGFPSFTNTYILFNYFIRVFYLNLGTSSL